MAVTGKPAIQPIKNLDVRAIATAVAAARQRIEQIEASLGSTASAAQTQSLSTQLSILRNQLTTLQATVAALQQTSATNTVTLVAAETIAQFDPVVYSSATTCVKADPADPSRSFGVIGIATTGASAGSNVVVQFMGVISIPTAAFALSQPVYAGDLGLTQTPSYEAAAIPVGVAVSATALEVYPGLPVMLSPGWDYSYEKYLAASLRYVEEADALLQSQIDTLFADIAVIDGQISTLQYEVNAIISPKPASTFYGGPVSGADAPPSFRALEWLDDIPLIDGLPTSSGLDGTEKVAIEMGGVWHQTTSQQIANLANKSSRTLWQYKGKTTATSGYPGDGCVLWNNATQVLATDLIFSHITDDNLDIDRFFTFLTTGDTIILQDANDSQNYQQWTIAGTPVNTNGGTATSYWTIPVSLQSAGAGGTGATNFPNNHQLVAVVFTAGGGSGTVTSVGLSLPAGLFSVSGSPVTSAGTLTGTLLTQSANTVFAGPSSGAAAAPAFRSLTLASADFANQGTATQVLHGNAAGAPSWGAVSLTADVSGTLPVSNGGTGVTSLSSLTANPSASVGLTAVNGSASTFMRSDAAPALSQSISPTWTGNHTFSPASGTTAITTGNLAVNLASPSTNLHVKGASGLRLEGTGTNTDTIDLVPGVASTVDRLDFKAVSTNRGVQFQLNPNGTSTTSKIALANTSSSSNFDSIFISAEGATAHISPQRVGTGGTALNALQFGGGGGAGTWSTIQFDTSSYTAIASGSFLVGTTTSTLGVLTVNTAGGDKVTIGDISNQANDTQVYLRTNGLAKFLVPSGGTGQFSWGLFSSTEFMRLDATGRLGIGGTLSSLTDKLTVSATAAQLRLVDTDDSTYTQFSYSGVKLAIRVNSTSADHFWMDSSGNVGVGVSPSGTYKLEVNGALSISSATMIRTATSFTNGAAAATGTLTNAPAAGNPTKWVPINDNGTTRYIPAW